MKIETEQDVFVSHINHEELGVGEILEISFDVGESLISVQWENGKKGQYWANELEFFLGTKCDLIKGYKKQII